jgi:hypothetical protein
MKKLLLLFFVFQWAYFQSQSILEMEQEQLKNNFKAHSEIKDFSFFSTDSIEISEDGSHFNISGGLDAIAGWERNRFAAQTGVLVRMNGSMGKKTFLRSAYRVGYSTQGNEAYHATLQPKALFHNSLKNEQQIYHDIRARLTHKANSIFTLETGIDNLYIGEGERSLLASNQGIALPFIQAKATFWKLSYLFNHQLGLEPNTKRLAPKGIATHYLSFQATKNLTFGVFESVVYDMRDTLYNRGFEFEYLNPLIFYRMQEYGLGSADNVLLGLHASYKLKNHTIYGQLVIDDFSVAEFRARSKWWANKYGFQLGVKGLFTWKENKVFYRTEVNSIRPFVYAHTAPGVVYGNNQLPIAHPLGSNIVEFYQEFATTIRDFRIEVWAQFYLKGNDFDTSSLSYGGDIYQSYVNYAQEYGVTIGSGQTYRAFQLGTQISHRFLNDETRFFIEPRGILSNNEGLIKLNGYFTIGFHSPLGSKRRNY